jgi:hypothetical protein
LSTVAKVTHKKVTVTLTSPAVAVAVVQGVFMKITATFMKLSPSLQRYYGDYYNAHKTIDRNAPWMLLM